MMSERDLVGIESARRRKLTYEKAIALSFDVCGGNVAMPMEIEASTDRCNDAGAKVVTSLSHVIAETREGVLSRGSLLDESKGF